MIQEENLLPGKDFPIDIKAVLGWTGVSGLGFDQ